MFTLSEWQSISSEGIPAGELWQPNYREVFFNAHIHADKVNWNPLFPKEQHSVVKNQKLPNL